MNDISETKNQQTITSITMQDWELNSDQDTASAVTENCKTKFTATVEIDSENGAIWFSVSEENLKGLDVGDFGLSGCIEIRNGTPAISVGMHPSANTIHIMSNGLDQLAVVPDSSDAVYKQGVVETSPQKYKAILFDLPDYAELCEEKVDVRKKIASNYINNMLPDVELNDLTWRETNEPNQLTTRFTQRGEKTESVCTIEFSDRSMSHITAFNVEPLENPSEDWYKLLSDSEIINVITSDSTITQLVNNCEDDSQALWTDGDIIEAVADAVNISLDETKHDVMRQLLMFFNKYDSTTDTYTVGNTTYHSSTSIITLLTSTDKKLIRILGYNSSDDIQSIRTGIVKDFENGNTSVTNKHCDHKNIDGSCAGHKK